MDEKATEYIRSQMPLCGTLGMRAIELSPAKVVLEMDWAAELCTANGLLHGGALMALADASGGACAAANLPEGAVGTSTIESKTNFLGAVKGGTVAATTTPLHVGGSTIVVETELRCGEKLVGKTTQTQTVLRPR
ncbi:PaaI family thioesterase [Cumulibacter manganitolerans]|uniref:PaaI family thioesterase n=1 Tax=Cumulibacter manganitolerans TaxID=1884992 RepID=UPI0012959810|nr:PaaI family thioesterase [Cumulibacter manganitolerans]